MYEMTMNERFNMTGLSESISRFISESISRFIKVHQLVVLVK